ncbi:ShlB/FhaC/HecB family hemolysin secretion/activation protein [Ideonella sp.]|uniref:ShlB/FhaC/HecB family hemolysin secretion/activation protein n=1 Tax=Ideonella sp. TaxID=1929293 RepID=UPI003BB73D38
MAASVRAALAALAASALAWPVTGALAQTAAPSAKPAESAPSEPRFDIWEYEIEGNTVLTVAQIERAVQPHLGPDKDMKAVEAARTALETLYQQAGFLTVLVDIPEQSVDAGVVQLRVIEGRIGSVYVAGSKYHALGQIRSRVAELSPGQVPDFNRVQAQIAALNRTEDRRVQPVIKPGLRPGTIDVELQVNDSLPFSGSVEVNNQHAKDTEFLRASAALRYNNLFQRDHSLALTLQTAPTSPDQSKVLVANYSLPTEDGQNWTFSLSLSDSEVATLGGTQVVGNGSTLGLRRSALISRSGGAAWVSWGADLKHLREQINFGTDSISTPVRYLPFQLAVGDQYDGEWGRIQINTSLTAAWNQLLSREVACPLANGSTGMQDQFACKRQGGDGSFVVGRWDLRWMSAYAWGSPSLRFSGQMAGRELISAEQFTLGGAETVRGYLESAASGDHGVLFSAEWRTPNFAELGEPGWRELRGLVFVDAGRVLTIAPPAGQAGHVNLWAPGLGLRWNSAATPGIEGAVDLAWPQHPSGDTVVGKATVHGRLRLRF